MKITKENVLLLLTLGIEVLKSMKVIYETKSEERILKDDDPTANTNRDSKENLDAYYRNIAP